MTQKNDTPLLILSLLITIGLIGGAIWWFGSHFSRQFSNSSPSVSQTTALNIGNLADRFSSGDKLLIPDGPLVNAEAKADKQQGIKAMQAKNYQQAITAFEAALRAKKNDPETLILLNNARSAERKQIYTLAVAVPIDTDVDASLEMLRGVAMAQAEFVQAEQSADVGLNIVIANDGNSPEIARQIAAELGKRSDVLGVVGHYASDVTIAAAEIYNQEGLVAISPVSTSVKLSNFGRFTFRTVPSDFVAARSLADYMLRQLKQQKAAVFFNSQSGYSQSLKSEFNSAVALGGGQIVSEFDLSSPNFSAADSVKDAAQRGATVLVLLPNSGQLDRALQVASVNQGQMRLLAGDDVYSPKTLTVGGNNVLNMVVAIPWHILANPNSAFANQSRQLWGGDVNWRTAMSYDATNALIQTFRNQPQLDRAKVQQLLSAPSFSATGATEPVQFLPSGDRNQAVQLVQVVPGKRSGYGYDFVPLNAAP